MNFSVYWYNKSTLFTNLSMPLRSWPTQKMMSLQTDYKWRWPLLPILPTQQYKLVREPYHMNYETGSSLEPLSNRVYTYLSRENCIWWNSSLKYTCHLNVNRRGFRLVLFIINFLLPATSSTPISVNSNIKYNNPLILYIGKSKQNLKQKNTSIQK